MGSILVGLAFMVVASGFVSVWTEEEAFVCWGAPIFFCVGAGTAAVCGKVLAPYTETIIVMIVYFIVFLLVVIYPLIYFISLWETGVARTKEKREMEERNQRLKKEKRNQVVTTEPRNQQSQLDKKVASISSNPNLTEEMKKQQIAWLRKGE
jgi:CBS domain containing-hemolysin-like protein